MSGDQTLLDVVDEVVRDLRRVQTFRLLLRPLNDVEARQVAEHFITFLYRELNAQPPAQR
jgi:hypothetical protein